jgi:autotransporter-associated beta strand protein
MSRLILSSADADGTVILQNGINTLPSAASPISRTIQVENGAAAIDARLTGVIAQEGGIIKTGAGTLELTAANTYSGPTSIDQGTLLVSGSLSASSPVSIRTGGTLRGNGTIGPIALAGGTLAPGAAVGALNSGNLAFNGGTLALEITDAATFDQLNVTGTVRFNAPTALSMAVANPLPDGTAFSIVTNNGIDDITFADANARLLYNGVPLDEGDTFTVSAGFGPQPFQISYLGDTGNDLVLTAIPEPGSVVLLTISIAGWLCAWRFRRSEKLVNWGECDLTEAC